MKSPAPFTVLLVMILARWSMAVGHPGQCGHRCPPPQWRAPSPTLDDYCHHASTSRFASYDCGRDYSSPHVLGYRGYPGYVGYQVNPCPCGLFRHGTYRWWASTYGDAPTPNLGGAGPYLTGCENPGLPGCGNPGSCELGLLPHDCECHPGWDHYRTYRMTMCGYEHLGQIPNDSAAAEAEAGGGGLGIIPGLSP